MDNNDKNRYTSDTTIQGETMWQFGESRWVFQAQVPGQPRAVPQLTSQVPGCRPKRIKLSRIDVEGASFKTSRSTLKLLGSCSRSSGSRTSSHQGRRGEAWPKLRAFLPLFSGHSTPDADAGCIPRRGTHVTLVRRNPTSFGNTLHRASHTSDPLMSASHCRMVSIFLKRLKKGGVGWIHLPAVCGFGGCFIPSWLSWICQAVPQLPKVVGKPQMIHSATPDLWVSWSQKGNPIARNIPQNIQNYILQRLR